MKVRKYALNNKYIYVTKDFDGSKYILANILCKNKNNDKYITNYQYYGCEILFCKEFAIIINSENRKVCEKHLEKGKNEKS
ncbi:hypothetical protein [Spiroplasma sp. SV19]|uniref:hypothetical protein n=1 Tax=Spiroplasma sp. SV19 TaxID=2570468 RepID=UPI0024B63A30|nr:hypothetical protein [Spiroplasma sp. SV19]WHQ36779.1 hypothetical protein E7Y35_02590 [Spiroplasma sp. SV19]